MSNDDEIKQVIIVRTIIRGVFWLSVVAIVAVFAAVKG